MDPLTQKLITHLRSITLSDTERAALRASLVAKIREGTVPRPVPSPWAWLLYAKRTQAAFLLAVIIISYGSTVTLAAEGSVPGDVLYPVKTRVSEPIVRMVTAISPEARATFETGLLEKRLKEAETLDTRETFDPALRQSVRRVIREQSERAEKNISDIEKVPVVRAPHGETSKSEIGTSSPENVSEKRSQRREDSIDDTREGDTRRALKEVREKHKRIIEKLDIDDDTDDKEERGGSSGRPDLPETAEDED